MTRLMPIAAMLVMAISSTSLPARTPPARVTLQTSEGAIVIALDTAHAPVTSANFLRYVDDRKFDGTTFYRASRAKGAPQYGFIQGGINHNIRRAFPPIAHEPTTKTGLHHATGTISMARNEPGTAMGDFFIVLGDAPAMDAHPGKPGDNLGYAAFGHVVSGMPVVKRILAAPTYPNAGSAAMKGQMIVKPVGIISARRGG